MALVTFGINHNTAPVDIREQATFGPEIVHDALRHLHKTTDVSEAAILSTCNRTEVYCDTDNINNVFDWFSGFHALSPKEIKPYVFSYQERDSIQHMLRVASGLDSLILGEPQILGQMKDAYRIAEEAGTLGKQLNRLFQHTFRVAKQVRTDTAIGASPVSVAFAAVSLAKQIFGSLADKTVLLVGAGETIELAARHLAENQIGGMIVANRSIEKAEHLAQQYNGRAIGLPNMATLLHEADIVISSTASPLPVLGKGTVESALKQRKHQPMFMVDIAVPRDIEPEVDSLEDVFLYTVDDLQDVISQNMQSRQDAAQQAEEIIAVQVKHFEDWLESQQSIATIQQYRDQAYQSKEALVQKAYRALEAGQPAQEVVDILAHRLTNQLLHSPCSTLRQSKPEEQAELIRAATTLFNIQD